MVDITAIDRLLQPYAKLDEQQLRLTSIYIDLLLKWNARINLTAVRDADEIVTRHFGESFFAAGILRSQAVPQNAIDVGSGAGFPGIPLAISMPHIQVTLIESNQKKSTFLREVISALKLKNVAVFSGRGEDYPDQADLVTMRAVERFEKALATAIELVEPGGRIALMIGASQAVLAKALSKDVEWNQPAAVPVGHSRILLVGTKEVKVG
ncbi:MAG TPA: 16S rRNA (guanine(527)-N(7))-methyltransferase RsmG [Candidatus Angelobacter sp.]|nr:16S rRNA (guanine(527)-N(7))-methyltransferase RsmG [Candidatus Angelobacter sp.]